MNSPNDIAKNYIPIGVAKTKYTIPRMLVLGILAGMFIALSGVGATIAQATLGNTSLASAGRLLGAAVFPVGLVMVVFTGSELFTGNCLIIIPVLQKEIKLRKMLKSWLIVYIGNFIGSLLIAAITVYGGTYSLFNGVAAANAIFTAVTKVNLTFGSAVLRSILCNFLVCTAIWISYASKDAIGKIVALFLPVMLFVASGYEHSIANMYFIPAGLLASANPVYLETYTSLFGTEGLSSLTWCSMLTNNLIPTTIGNIIGGAFLVGFVCWFLYRGTDKQ